MGTLGGNLGILEDPAFVEGRVPGASLPSEEGYTPSSQRGSWPRMLVLDSETESRLTRWLEFEIRNARLEKVPLIEDWEQWQTDYWAEPQSKVKNFPFERAANIVVPVTAIAVEAVHARLMNTLFMVEPFWSIRARSSAWVDAAPRIENWLQSHANDQNSLSVFEFASESLMELIKLGTCVGKSGYEKDIRKTIRMNGDSEDIVWVERRNGATLDYVPVANFLIRMSESNPQTATWVGEEHVFTWSQLKQFALSGRMMESAIERIKSHWNSSRTQEAGNSQKYHEHVESLSSQEPIWWEKFDVQEIWCSFDVDGDGVDEEIVLDFHHETQTILSIRYNWYGDLHRPYRMANYVPVEGRAFGIGVGKQNEQLQHEITTIHRQRLDNATLANMFNIVVKKTSGYGPREPVWPGKMWLVDDVADIAPLQLSTTYPEAHTNEERVLSYSERRTGVNEVLLGMPQQGTPGTATGDLARIAEGNKRFDLVLRNVRRFFSQLGMDVISNFQEFGNRKQHWLVLEEDGQYVEQILQFPSELVSNGAVIDLTATSSITNQQVEQQNWMQLFQVSTAFYDKVLERSLNLAQVTGDPSVFVMMSQEALRASNEAYKRLLETFNIIGAESLLIGGGQDVEGNGIQQQPALLEPPQPAGGGGLPGDNGNAGLEGLDAVLGSLGGLA